MPISASSSRALNLFVGEKVQNVSREKENKAINFHFSSIGAKKREEEKKKEESGASICRDKLPSIFLLPPPRKGQPC